MAHQAALSNYSKESKKHNREPKMLTKIGGNSKQKEESELIITWRDPATYTVTQGPFTSTRSLLFSAGGLFVPCPQRKRAFGTVAATGTHSAWLLACRRMGALACRRMPLRVGRPAQCLPSLDLPSPFLPFSARLRLKAWPRAWRFGKAMGTVPGSGRGRSLRQECPTNR